MDGTTIDSLELKINASAEGAENGLDRLINTLGKLRAVTSKLNLSRVTEQITKFGAGVNQIETEKADSLARVLESLSGIGEVKISATIPNNIKKIAEATQGIDTSDIDKVRAMGEALQSFKDVENVHIPEVQGSPIGADATGAARSAADSLDTVSNSANRLQSILGNVRETFASVFPHGVNLLGRIGSAAQAAGAKIKEIVKQTALLPVTTIRQMASAIQTFSARLRGVFERIGNVVFRRAIRSLLRTITSGFREGLQNLYAYSDAIGGQFAHSMDRLATSANYLKNSLGAMAAPLINALAPAIDFVVDKLVGLFNLFNQFFSRLTGASSVTVAKKVASAWGDAGKSTSAAAKEAQRSLLAFDELNTLSKQSSGGGGSGGGGAGGSMFEEIPIDSGIADFADKIKALFAAQDWQGLGTLLGEKINAAVDSVDWGGLGAKVGNALNGIIQTAYWLLDTVNFTKIGSHIAEFLNNAISAIDFSYLGRLMVKGLTSIFDMVIGFFTTFDWGAAAKALSDFIKGLFAELTKWLNSHDWASIGKTIWEKIKDIIANIDFAGIVSAFFTLLGTALRAGVQLLGGFIQGVASDIGGALYSFFSDAVDGQPWYTVIGNILTGIGKGILSIGEWVVNNIVGPFVAALLGQSWSDLKPVADNIRNFFTQNVANLYAEVSQKWAVLKQNTAEAWENIRQKTVEVWTGIKTTMVNLFTQAKNNITSSINSLRNTMSTAWNTMRNITSSAWNSIKNTAVSLFSSLSSAVYSKWINLKSLIGNVDWRSIGANLVQGLANGISGAWGGLMNMISNLINNLISSIKSWFGVHSPSTVFRDIGINLDAGLEQGIEWGTEPLIETASSIADAVTDALTPDLSNMGSSNNYGVSRVIGDTGLIIDDSDDSASDGGYLAGIAEAVNRIVARMGDGGDGDMKIVIDGREVFNVVVAENNRAIQRTGASPIRV